MSKKSCLETSVWDITKRLHININPLLNNKLVSKIRIINPKVLLKCIKATPTFNCTLEKISTNIKCKIKLKEDLKISTRDVYFKKHLKFTCGIICTKEEIEYLKVSPEEIQWITPDMGIIYQVESNTDWVILTE